MDRPPTCSTFLGMCVALSPFAALHQSALVLSPGCVNNRKKQLKVVGAATAVGGAGSAVPSLGSSLKRK